MLQSWGCKQSGQTRHAKLNWAEHSVYPVSPQNHQARTSCSPFLLILNLWQGLNPQAEALGCTVDTDKQGRININQMGCPHGETSIHIGSSHTGSFTNMPRDSEKMLANHHYESKQTNKQNINVSRCQHQVWLNQLLAQPPRHLMTVWSCYRREHNMSLYLRSMGS